MKRFNLLESQELVTSIVRKIKVCVLDVVKMYLLSVTGRNKVL